VGDADGRRALHLHPALQDRGVGAWVGGWGNGVHYSCKMLCSIGIISVIQGHGAKNTRISKIARCRSYTRTSCATSRRRRRERTW
jgi:hypothetical protein